MIKITAQEGMTFIRIHDGFDMGDTIYLGVDYSTGEPRVDKPDFYQEVPTNVTE